MMQGDQKIRIFFVLIFIFFLYSALIVRLIYLQIIYYHSYSTLSKGQYTVQIEKYCQRAKIVDRNDIALATNKNYYSIFILPHMLKDKDNLLLFLKEFFPSAAKRLDLYKTKKFMYIKRKLTKEEVDVIREYEIKDLCFIDEPGRSYPYDCTASLVGSTDIDNQGISGIEKLYNDMLIGVSAKHELVQDAHAHSFYFNPLNSIEGEKGKEIKTTIDLNLQFIVQQKVQEVVDNFGSEKAAALIIDPKTGDILSLVNNNNKSEKVSENYVTSETYEFGSILKIVTAMACLENNLVFLDEMIDCKNSKTAIVHNRIVNTTIAQGVVPFVEVIAKSNNIGIATVAQRLGEDLYCHYKKVGFGKKLEVPGLVNVSGFINPPEKWSKHSLISLSYGYEVSSTLLQLAQFFCMIAQNGYPVTLRLIFLDEDNNEGKNKNKDPLYKKQTIEDIKTILEATTLHGTAKKAKIDGYRVMAKTGTANLLINGKYDKTKNIFSCAGIVEKGNYQRVIALFIKNSSQSNLYAATVAAPLFESIAENMIIYDRI